MANEWLSDFAGVLDKATGVVQAAANVVNPPKMTTVSTPSPQAETAPKQKLAAVDTNVVPKSTFPWWALPVGLVVLLAIVEH